MNTTIETTVPVRSTSARQSFLSPVWSPMERLASLRQDMDRLWEATFPGRSAALSVALSVGWSPALDLYDEPEQLVAKVELPGFTRETIELNYQDGVLTIAGERKSDYAEGKEPDAYLCERMTGRFSRDIHLPVPVQADKIGACYKHGVLSVTLPKSEDAKPHKVEVTVA
jgi:HSP20 family protein